jgi:TPR repeat protein
LHPGALYLLGAVYLTGDCVKRDIASAMWCFHRASEKVSIFSREISGMKKNPHSYFSLLM